MLTTAWLKPPQPAAGQDHLGTMAPAVTLYSQLLPGVTNVTERARAYSFYPWLIWAIDQSDLPKDPESLVKWVRRAECLWCLIGLSHGEGSDAREHGGGITGRNTLERVWAKVREGHTVKLSRYATVEDAEDRYFKARLGGLGQYYLGPLSELRILSGDASSGLEYDRKRGASLAQALEGAVNAKAFIGALKEDVVSRESLAKLAPFCPCGLHSSRLEMTLLRDLFFNRPGMFFSAADEARPKSLGLLLALAQGLQRSPRLKTEFGVAAFRACVYSGALDEGEPWTLPAALESHRQLWALYEESELLSLALQALFWVTLTALGRTTRLPGSSAAARWVTQTLGEQALGSLKQPLSKLVSARRRSLPTLAHWQQAGHEVQRATSLFERTSESEAEETVITMEAAIDVLLALVIRGEGRSGSAYAGFVMEPDHLASYPVNLDALHRLATEDWRALTAEEWLRWLLTEWGIELHFRVALRKLRHESLDTFRVRPGEEGLEVVGPWPPAQTNPRVARACQMLRDLGLLEVGENDAWKLTGDGRKTLMESWP